MLVAILIGVIVTTILGAKNMAAIDRLTTEVAELRTVNESAIALVTSLAQQIRDNIDNEDALNALADEIDASSNALASAVTANTPASEDGEG